MRLRVIVLCFLLLAVSGGNLVDANSGGKYQSGSGCSCHYAGSATVSMSGQPATYTAGQTYTLSISVSGGVSGSAGGFSLEVDKGTLSTGGVGIMAVKVNPAGNSATHTTSSYRSWSVDWTAPSSGSGTTAFDLAGLTANGNGNNNGDSWGTASYQVSEGGSPPSNNPPSVSNLLLTPSNPTVLTGLALTYSYSDSDGDALTYVIASEPSNGTVELFSSIGYLDFDGSDDYIQIPYTQNSVLDFSDNSSKISIMLWVKMSSATQPEDILLESGDGDGWRFLAEVYNSNSGGNWGFRVKGNHSSASTEHQADTALGIGTWTHL